MTNKKADFFFKAQTASLYLDTTLRYFSRSTPGGGVFPSYFFGFCYHLNECSRVINLHMFAEEQQHAKNMFARPVWTCPTP